MQFSVVFVVVCGYLMLSFNSNVNNGFIVPFLQSPTQEKRGDDAENCETSPSFSDPSIGGVCAIKSPLLYGAVNSGLLNEITDVDDFLTRRARSTADYSTAKQNAASAQFHEFLDRLPKSGYDNRLRPFISSRPVRVSCSMYIGAIYSVSESNMDFTVDIYFRQAWHDHRLRWSNENLGEQDALSIGGDYISFLWRPDTYIPNAKLALFHHVTRHNAFLRIMPQGHVKQSMRITVTAHCPMDFRLFPLDSQRCDILIESFALPVTDLIYTWRHFSADSINSKQQSASATKNRKFNRTKTTTTTTTTTAPPAKLPPPISIGADSTTLPQFVIRGFRALETYVERIEGRNHSRLVVEIYFSRSLGYYLIQIYLPASLVVVISWVSFWIPRHSQPARVTLGVTTVLTLTMMTGQGISSLPKISYLKALDLFMIFCFSMVFLALIEYAMVSYATKRTRINQRRGKEQFNYEGETILSPRYRVAEQFLSAVPFAPVLLAVSSPDVLRQRSVSFAAHFGSDINNNGTANNQSGWSLTFPESLPSRIEWFSRLVFPLTFFIFNIWYWLHFLNKKKLATADDMPGFNVFIPS